jgi:Tfp pilus assembly protein PilF
MKAATLLAAVALVFTLTGCSRPTIPDLHAKLQALTGASAGATRDSEAELLLERGLSQYEEGEYADAAESLYAALHKGLPRREQVSAHKHLAFIYCSADLEPACRNAFRDALAADPRMDLDAAEAGHPGWGPVFQHVRAGR